MARLIGESVDYVCSHRLEVAKAFAKENDVIVVLRVQTPLLQTVMTCSLI